MALILAAEATVASLYLDGESLLQKHGPLTGLVRAQGASSIRFVIGFAALFTTFAWLRYKAALAGISVEATRAPIRARLIAAHLAAMAVFAALSAALYSPAPSLIPPDRLAAGCLIASIAAIASVALALLPWPLWLSLVKKTGNLWIYAGAVAALACWLGPLSRTLWAPTTRLTFAIVKLLLSGMLPNLIVQPAIMRIGTERFAARISPECSGLEGAALLLSFGALWLFLFRRQTRFPHALVLLPAGVAVLFLLNAVRIAALIMIGHAGFREIAARGFHSQAGWIAFNGVALCFSVAARRLPWFSVRPALPVSPEKGENPASAYLVPFLMILAAGMLSRSLSGTFEWLYPLRFFAAAGALWLFRRKYADLDWKCGWLPPVAGAVVFVLWIAVERLMAVTHAGSRMPAVLAGASLGLRVLWIAFRALAAVSTVPLAEELAFRGFLLRRLISPDFETVSFRAFTWFSLIASSLCFGLMHGERWLAGTAAGLVYALVVRRAGRLTDAVVAHATTNALLAAYVLVSQNWDMW